MHFSNGYAYQEFHADRSALLPTVLIHGAGSSHLGWPAAIRRLPGMHILTIDLPNHGAAEKKDLHSIEEYAVDLHAFLLGLEMKRVNLVGYSMGSAIALQLLLRFPAICCRAALLAYAPQPSFNEISAPHGPQNELSVDWQQVFMDKLLAGGFSNSQKEKLLQPFLVEDAATLKHDLWITHTYHPRFPDEKLPTPVMFLNGAADPFMNVEEKQSMLASFAEPVIKEIHNAGHLFLWEYPELVRLYLADFFSQN
ncbi:MAG TPA: alpha/beta hydrolase [Anaerolineaceae bacterium]|nr:alpha/beta hydrolase [Anaerolineaceae bacterium]